MRGSGSFGFEIWCLSFAGFYLYVVVPLVFAACGFLSSQLLGCLSMEITASLFL